MLLLLLSNYTTIISSVGNLVINRRFHSVNNYLIYEKMYVQFFRTHQSSWCIHIFLKVQICRKYFKYTKFFHKLQVEFIKQIIKRDEKDILESS